jgi:hypothetical protein
MPTASPFVPAPAFIPRSARATLWAVVDCGRQAWWFEERPRHVREVRFIFELLDRTLPDGTRRCLTRRYAFSFWPTANLKRDVEAMLGRPLTLAERAGAGMEFLAPLAGRSCWLDIAERGTYRAITAITPLPVDFPAHRPLLYLSLDAFDPAAFHRLPNDLKDRILASPTFQAVCDGGLDPEALWPAEHRRDPTAADALQGDDIPW